MTDGAAPPPATGPGAKTAWRRWARQRRASGTIDHAGHRRALARFLAGPGRPAGWVVIYRALDDEVRLEALVDRARLGPFALIRTPERGHELTVHPADGPLERHRHGYLQPPADAPTVPDRDIAVVVVPGLLFDRTGRRLGRGGGYYDRFLARLPVEPIRVGVTGGFVVDGLPVDPHDVPMTHLLDGTALWSVGVTSS